MHAPLAIQNVSEPEPDKWGPKMAALATDKQRAFVVEMYRVAPGKGAPVRAAVAAGYGTPRSSRASISVIAYRLVNDERIQAALAEHGRQRFHELFPLALSSLESLLKNKSHRDHGRAVMGIIERLAPAEFLHRHEHEHRHRIDMATMVEQIKSLAVKLDLPAAQLLGINSTPEVTTIENHQTPTGADHA